MPSSLPRRSLVLALSLLASFAFPGAAADYTGLIIDARGLPVERSMAPLLESQGGTLLYPHFDAEHPLDVEAMLAEGLALYASSIEEAWQLKRLGGMPLVLKATASQGNELVLDEENSRELLQADHEARFLEKHAVAIVY